MNNSAAMMALGELKKNDTMLGKALKKVASVMRINNAGDGASEYAISEKMRVRLRSLGQDIVNTQTGKALLRTAEGGIQEIINNLRDMKAKAIDAADDHNTDADRAMIQKEQDSRIQAIDDIANTTDYNGRLLLNGNYSEKYVQASNASSTGPARSSGWIADSMATEPAGAATTIPSGDYAITSDGNYVLPQGYTGHVTINATNVKISQADPTEKLYRASFECKQPGTTLWLDNVTAVNGANPSVSRLVGFAANTVKFTGSGNELHFIGTVSLYGGDNGSTNKANERYAVLNMGDSLTIYGEGADSSLTSVSVDGGSGLNPGGAGIGTDTGQNTKGELAIKGLSSLKASCEFGAAIGAGAYGSIGSITIDEVGSISVYTANGAGIGSGDSASKVSSIRISANSLVGGLTSWMDAYENVVGRADSVIINADTIFLAALSATSRNGDHIGVEGPSGRTIIASSATINGVPYDPNGQSFQGPSAWDAFKHQFDGMDDIDDGNDYTVKNEMVFEYPYDDASPTEDPSSTSFEHPRLIIHTGTKANQNLRVFINDMRPDALGIENILMDPIENAKAALSVLDRAIDYALNENTRMGAYQTQLGFTATNLTTSSENTQASESTIRDADMAKEMAAYTKANVLAQSAQAMLAQANQNASSVLSLLQ